ncbi:Caltractin, putative [Perkinsus marinus ATCC 50983]|uniref:Caltractin, putative n=1 Tax=Perkinsus marinus (strain ATCC 50983 / TXsc) TaxID=423536 RepID=C5KS27_PERM5|nr:Caltractin, putative [Perkinsus marinus ATCC 50983]EER12718.1 Caltractin, putative [Perkinsus marinus ATCC 50983]|eukprot:XP_002780923.1 Caltractin, putative [Perkinsus marinus ATCC 50983]
MPNIVEAGGVPPASSVVAKRPLDGKRAMTLDQLEEVREAFALFDSDNSGCIDAREIKAAMRALGIEDVSKDMVGRMLADVGKHPSQTVTLDEFCDMMAPKMASKDSREEIMKIFKLFDEDNIGKITFRSLKRVSTELGENIPDDELMEMIEEADRSGDGTISFDEFYRVMRRNTNGSGCLLDDFDSDEDL